MRLTWIQIPRYVRSWADWLATAAVTSGSSGTGFRCVVLDS